MENNIGHCGVCCSSCTDYINKICPSCRLTEWKDDDICMPVKCCREKEIESCAFCTDFPCDDMNGFYEESSSHKEAYERMGKTREENGLMRYARR